MEITEIACAATVIDLTARLEGRNTAMRLNSRTTGCSLLAYLKDAVSTHIPKILTLQLGVCFPESDGILS